MPANKFYSLFSLAYLAVFLFCIFMGVESWPFSDFGVYKSQHHPERVEVYKLGYEGESREPIWYFPSYDKRNTKSVDDHIKRLSEQERAEWLKSFVLLPQTKSRATRSELILYRLTLSPAVEGYRLETEPYLRAQLQ